MAYQMGCSIARAHHPASEYDSNDDHADGDVGESERRVFDWINGWPDRLEWPLFEP